MWFHSEDTDFNVEDIQQISEHIQDLLMNYCVAGDLLMLLNMFGIHILEEMAQFYQANKTRLCAQDRLMDYCVAGDQLTSLNMFNMAQFCLAEMVMALDSDAPTKKPLPHPKETWLKPDDSRL